MCSAISMPTFLSRCINFNFVKKLSKQTFQITYIILGINETDTALHVLENVSPVLKK